MKKLTFPLLGLLLLAACGEEETEVPEQEETRTEVSAPRGEPDPTEVEDVEDARPVTFEELANGEIEEGTAVSLTGTVEDLTDDNAFPAFILSDGETEIFVRNMAQAAVAVGDTVSVNGIYDGIAEENMPLVSVTQIE